jgi:hypothetical protein
MPTSSADEAIADFATCGHTFPRQSIRWALDNWHEAGPRFVKLLEDCVAGADGSEATMNALFFVVHLLAEKREAKAFPALCTLVEDWELCEDVLGDAVTETLTAVLIGTWNGDGARLKQLVESEVADQFARTAALDALAYLTRQGAFGDEEMRTYLAHLAETMQPRAASFVWTGWATVVANLGYADFRGQVAQFVERGFIEPMDMGLDDFDVDLQRTLADPTGWAGFEYDRIGPFNDTIGALSKWAHFTEKPARGAYDPPAGRSMPHVDPWRKVGRNDPCPCGSGKKYKKCCLQ